MTFCCKDTLFPTTFRHFSALFPLFNKWIGDKALNDQDIAIITNIILKRKTNIDLTHPPDVYDPYKLFINVGVLIYFV